MTFTTPLNRWIRAVAIDVLLIGGFGYALHLGSETAMSIFAFFFWWMVTIALFVYFIIAIVGANKDRVDDKGAPVGEVAYAKFWNEKIVDRTAQSTAFILYHILTDLLMVILLLLSGRWVLASFKMFTLIASVLVIQHARYLKEARQSVVA